jgi:NAD(P)-dependent dehydrogenase (short-subunit alcohol dehydrogenase family)
MSTDFDARPRMGTPMLLEGKIILISGGTRGLGAGIAPAAVAEGAAGIMITGRDRAAGEALAGDLAGNGTDIRFHAVDLADPLAAASSVSAAVASFGRIDCVVNSAGITTRGTLVDTTVELFDAHIAINLRAPFFIMQAAVEDMRSRQAPGSIVNIISFSAHGGQPYLAPYVAAKAGMVGLTRNAAYAHALTGSESTDSTSAGLKPRARMPPNAPSTAQTTIGFPRPPPGYPWASSARSLRSPSSWCSYSPTGAVWSLAR